MNIVFPNPLPPPSPLRAEVRAHARLDETAADA
jgi:hypothetical protein